MSTLYSVGQMNQLGDALEGAGFTLDDVTKLRSSPSLADIRLVLLGRATIQVIQHLIDCDADPLVPTDWKVEQHIKGGQFVFDPTKVLLYLSKRQQNGNYILGDDLRKELRRKPVLNANVLDYLLAHPEIIPEEWKKNASGNTRYIFFWGTIYRHSGGYLFVRCLYFGGGRWDWDCRWLVRRWHGGHPAVVVAPAS